jgi:hypothetical protein
MTLNASSRTVYSGATITLTLVLTSPYSDIGTTGYTTIFYEDGVQIATGLNLLTVNRVVTGSVNAVKTYTATMLGTTKTEINSVSTSVAIETNVPKAIVQFPVDTNGQNWYVPAGVTSINILCIGHGGQGYISGGGGGGLAYYNYYPVVPNQRFVVYNSPATGYFVEDKNLPGDQMVVRAYDGGAGGYGGAGVGGSFFVRPGGRGMIGGNGGRGKGSEFAGGTIIWVIGGGGGGAAGFGGALYDNPATSPRYYSQGYNVGINGPSYLGDSYNSIGYFNNAYGGGTPYGGNPTSSWSVYNEQTGSGGSSGSGLEPGNGIVTTYGAGGGTPIIYTDYGVKANPRYVPNPLTSTNGYGFQGPGGVGITLISYGNYPSSPKWGIY